MLCVSLSNILWSPFHPTTYWTFELGSLYLVIGNCCFLSSGFLPFRRSQPILETDHDAYWESNMMSNVRGHAQRSWAILVLLCACSSLCMRLAHRPTRRIHTENTVLCYVVWNNMGCWGLPYQFMCPLYSHFMYYMMFLKKSPLYLEENWRENVSSCKSSS